MQPTEQECGVESHDLVIPKGLKTTKLTLPADLRHLPSEQIYPILATSLPPVQIQVPSTKPRAEPDRNIVVRHPDGQLVSASSLLAIKCRAVCYNECAPGHSRAPDAAYWDKVSGHQWGEFPQFF